MMQGAPVRMFAPHPQNSHLQIRGNYQGVGQRAQYVPIQQQELMQQQQQQQPYYQQQPVYVNNYPQYNIYQPAAQGNYQTRPNVMYIQSGGKFV